MVYLQVESLERRSRRDMSPQGRKRATAMVARDCRTVSGIGQSYHNNQTTSHVSQSIDQSTTDLSHCEVVRHTISRFNSLWRTTKYKF